MGRTWNVPVAFRAPDCQESETFHAHPPRVLALSAYEVHREPDGALHDSVAESPAVITRGFAWKTISASAKANEVLKNKTEKKYSKKS